MRRFKSATIANPASLIFGNNYNVLDNVSLGNSTGLTVIGDGSSNVGFVHIADAFSFTSGSVFNLGTSTGSAFSDGHVEFDSTSNTPTQTFNNATVNVGSTNGHNGYVEIGYNVAPADTFTLGSGLTIQGRGGVGAIDNSSNGLGIINNGLIDANMASASWTVQAAQNGVFTNNGTIEATASNAAIIFNSYSGGGTLLNNGSLLRRQRRTRLQVGTGSFQSRPLRRPGLSRITRATTVVKITSPGPEGRLAGGPPDRPVHGRSGRRFYPALLPQAMSAVLFVRRKTSVCTLRPSFSVTPNIAHNSSNTQ